MLQVQNLSFHYPNKKVLQSVSFSAKKQSITALVGPNGAGKTTLLSCISTLYHPLSGNVFLNHQDVHISPRESRSRIAYLADFFGLYEQLTVYQALDYMANANAIEKNKQKDAIDWVVENLDLSHFVNKKPNQLSRGQRQRVGIAYTIIHQPELILLDEPASGLDPEAREKLSTLLLNLKSQGMTLIVSSHILAELESYCDAMIILKDGKIIQENSLMNQATIPYIIKSLTPNVDVLKLLQANENCQQIKVVDDKIIFDFSAADEQLAVLMETLVKNNIRIVECYKKPTSMQDSYLQSINRDNREA